MRALPAILATALVALAALPAAAQYSQYTEPGAQPFEEVPTKEVLEKAMDEAKWHVAKVRVDPWYGVRNAGWVDNVYGSSDDPESDFTITVGLGLHAYSRLGPKAIFAAHALPEYVWWSELDDRRVVNGRYGAGVFGFLNRLRFEVSATTGRQMQYLSSEVEQPVNLRRDQATGTMELRMSGHLALVGSAETTRHRYREEDISGPLGEELLALDRDEDRFRAGLRYYLDKRFYVGVGVEDIAVDFDRKVRDRSSSGTSPTFEVRYDRDHFGYRFTLVRADLEPEPGSGFVAYDDTLGRFLVRLKPRAKLEWQLYGRRNLVYSVQSESPYFTDERLGLAAAMPVGDQAALRLFAETGANDYVRVAGVAPRSDDLTAFGASFGIRLYKQLYVRASASTTDYDARHGGGDRSVTRLGIGISVGESTSQWW